jgi:hypothetical protein
MSDRLHEQWAETQRMLGVARDQLTDPNDDDLRLYEEFLNNNELGLALDALADAAINQRAPREVWVALWNAAQGMGLTSADTIHGPTVDRIAERLNAAHEWRGLQRLLNEWDPIGVSPDLGGPDDEYSCLYGPLMTSLQREASAPEIAGFLRAELSDHFGINPDASRPDEFAGRLVKWFRSGAPA